ncbi:response regulator [Fundidesulfovibrio butyratiphilus]
MTPSEPFVVLVVDDEQHIRENLVDALEDYGFKALCVPSAEEGLEVLDKTHVDACTVDMRLPGMNGNAFILAANAKRPALKFVIYTGTPKYDIPPEVASLGVTLDQVIKKPAPSCTVLVDALRGLLDARGASFVQGRTE